MSLTLSGKLKHFQNFHIILKYSESEQCLNSFSLSFQGKFSQHFLHDVQTAPKPVSHNWLTDHNSMKKGHALSQWWLSWRKDTHPVSARPCTRCEAYFFLCIRRIELFSSRSLDSGTTAIQPVSMQESFQSMEYWKSGCETEGGRGSADETKVVMDLAKGS